MPQNISTQAALIPITNTTERPQDGSVTKAGLTSRLSPFQASTHFTISAFKSTYSSSRPIEKQYLIISADQGPYLFIFILYP